MSTEASTVVIVDNGAHTIKTGFSTAPASSHRKIYNAAIRSKGDKRLYVGHEFENCKDYASLNYRLPFERGYLIDWDVQKAVWDGLFGPEALSVDFRSTSILMTEPPFNLHNVQEKYDQLVFEEYEFASYVRSPVACLLSHGKLFPTNPTLMYPECSLIVDSGFSFTHVIPVLRDEIIWDGVRRIDIGGKLLTNHLSMLVSFRQWNMLDQTHIVNDVKEKCCYVSSSFSRDLELCRSSAHSKSMTLDYVLPDFSRNRHGFVRKNTTSYVPSGPTATAGMISSDSMDLDGDDQVADTQDGKTSSMTQEEEPLNGSAQILHMSNERFSVPELLFRPNDIGLKQSGLPATIAHSIASLPQELQGMFWANIGLIGGNIKFPGFKSRLCEDLRSLAPVEYEVGVYEADDPITETYISAHAFANSDAFKSLAVTREEYNEGGTNACRRNFRNLDWDPIKDKVDDISRAARRERDKVRYKGGEDSDGKDSDEEPKRKVARKPPIKKVEKIVANRPRRDPSRAK